MKYGLWMLPLAALAGCGLSAIEIGAGAAAAYYAKDGFVWQVEDRRVAPDTYRITVTQGRFKESGAGEAEARFRQRAEEIAATQGCSGYTVLEFTQSVISDPIWFAQRVSEGTIRCDRAPPRAPAAS